MEPSRPEIHPASLPDEQLLRDCIVRRTRHGGPGGQHRNKVETAIEVVHQPTGLVGFAAETRSQHSNRQVAIRRLRVILAVQIRTVHDSVVMPGPLWQQRCRGQKIICSESHTDFPALLAEAMNAVHATQYDAARAAAALNCSTTQLIRFIARVPDALIRVNEERIRLGMHKLHG